MKKILYAFAFILPLCLSAQNKQDFTPEQLATIKSKEMSLTLNLNEIQEIQIKNLLIPTIEKKRKWKEKHSEMKNKSVDERYQMKIKYLNGLKKFQSKMKEILTPEQYKDWKKLYQNHHKRKKHHKDRTSKKHH